MTAIVINADDVGLDSDADGQVLLAIMRGWLRSVSLVANGHHSAEFVALVGKTGHEIGFGLHFNMTQGQPLGHAPALVDDQGLFLAPKQKVWELLATGRIDRASIEAEARAQLQVIDALGVSIDHIDSHNHVHCYPQVLDGLLAALDGRSVHVRIPHEPEAAVDELPGMSAPRLSPEEMRRRIEAAGCHCLPRFVGYRFSVCPGIESVAHLQVADRHTEWMVHPGSWSASAFTRSECRDIEAATLRCPAMFLTLDNWGYEPRRFGDLA